jgi:hypothetical protein
VVPELEAKGAQLATEFLLSAESKGLRRTLQTDLGMVAQGIHPGILRHETAGVTRSEISAAKYKRLEPQPARIVPEFEPLYRIVQDQIRLPEPEVTAGASVAEPRYAAVYQELSQPVPADDPGIQAAVLEAGFQPVAYDPQRNRFRVAILPERQPDLSFILDNESIEANKRLVRYMQTHLYRQPEGGRDV